MQVEARTVGLNELQARMQRMLGTTTLRVQVNARDTQGSVQRKKGTVDVSRSGRENVGLLKIHAKQGRDVVFLTPSDAEQCQSTWTAAINRWIADTGVSAAPLVEAAKRIGDFIRSLYQKHIETRQGESGAIPPCKPSVEEQKERETGKKNLPPLVRTGQLISSLVVEVLRL